MGRRFGNVRYNTHLYCLAVQADFYRLRTHVNEIRLDPERVTQIILDSSVYAVNGDLNIDAEMTICIEKISWNICYALHKRRCELLSLKVK